MIGLVLTLALIGCLLYVITTFIPMDPALRAIIRIVVVVLVVLWLVQFFGLRRFDLPLPHF